MTKRILPTPEQLRELLRYEPDTGKLFWLARPEGMFFSGNTSSSANCKAWNTKYAGKEAITAKCNGYLYGAIFGKMFYAHRLAWAMFHGCWPDSQVDHMNGDKSDNRIANLRNATPSENSCNRTATRGKSGNGLKGITLVRGGKWQAQIRYLGVYRYLGTFDSAEDAHYAYREAAEKLHGKFVRF